VGIVPDDVCEACNDIWSTRSSVPGNAA